VQEGATVVICDVSASILEETKREIDSTGGRCMVLVFGIGRKGEVDAAVDSVMSESGRIWVQLNSAGIVLENNFLDISQEEW
jgi:NAD(P)-dependent dehydrogenase (short-subunit alcohol dehydrogenase family)